MTSFTDCDSPASNGTAAVHAQVFSDAIDTQFQDSSSSRELRQFENPLYDKLTTLSQDDVAGVENVTFSDDPSRVT